MISREGEAPPTAPGSSRARRSIPRSSKVCPHRPSRHDYHYDSMPPPGPPAHFLGARGIGIPPRITKISGDPRHSQTTALLVHSATAPACTQGCPLRIRFFASPRAWDAHIPGRHSLLSFCTLGSPKTESTAGDTCDRPAIDQETVPTEECPPCGNAVIDAPVGNRWTASCPPVSHSRLEKPPAFPQSLG